jgi:hypothetical protein
MDDESLKGPGVASKGAVKAGGGGGVEGEGGVRRCRLGRNSLLGTHPLPRTGPYHCN